jgi:hypothetical protein
VDAASSASGWWPSLVFFDRKPNKAMVLRRHADVWIPRL